MNPEQHAEFPVGRSFLEKIEVRVDAGSEAADSYSREAGEKLPLSIERLGTVLSYLYRAACCAWGCRGGDHQVEWLAGRVVNQAMSGYRLIRAGYYDEALVMARGIGEITNLVFLFGTDAQELENWKKADRGTRLRDYGPAAVRKKLKALRDEDPPIDDERYKHLCEVGTHPVPGVAPGHFSGSGRPVLGVYLQPVGMFVGVTELSYAVAMAALPLSKLLGLKDGERQLLWQAAVDLIKTLGGFNILNYNELLAKALQSPSGRQSPDAAQPPSSAQQDLASDPPPLRRSPDPTSH